MAVFRTPDLGEPELRVVAQIEECRSSMIARYGDRSLRRWVGDLRRMSLARNVQGSNSIEGYDASLDDVMAAMDGDEPLDAPTETRLAVEGYRDAMTYVLQIAEDDGVEVDAGMLRALHFMMLKHDLTKSPGSWRKGPVYVRSEPSGEIVYEAPPHEDVPELIEEMLTSLRDDSAPVLVQAAMAHLNLVMIHPYSDGNGRMARCLQTLVLSRGEMNHPAFSSIEEYLGRNTPSYYAILAEVGQGAWHPENCARPWVRYCLTAHLRQAKTVERRFLEAEQLWLHCDQLAQELGLPERVIAALWEAAKGLRIRRPGYLKGVERSMGEEISPLTASRDLRDLVRAGMLVPRGETRGRYYLASDRLREAWTSIRARRPAQLLPDPFTADDHASVIQ